MNGSIWVRVKWENDYRWDHSKYTILWVVRPRPKLILETGPYTCPFRREVSYSFSCWGVSMGFVQLIMPVVQLWCAWAMLNDWSNSFTASADASFKINSTSGIYKVIKNETLLKMAAFSFWMHLRCFHLLFEGLSTAKQKSDRRSWHVFHLVRLWRVPVRGMLLTTRARYPFSRQSQHSLATVTWAHIHITCRLVSNVSFLQWRDLWAVFFVFANVVWNSKGFQLQNRLKRWQAEA